MMTQYTFAACGQRNATGKYEHAPMIRARQVAQANTHLEDEELIEKNSAGIIVSRILKIHSMPHPSTLIIATHFAHISSKSFLSPTSYRTGNLH